ncbi:oxidation resistance protein 1-like isoform X2 [Coregonus clupeaformis]|uniref:oxidation resistance protein 1-like isoform X2 n=1 Tax=Coregonus clupeaformis TaxID=59861 RepID=UPI001E1C5CBB|nr:oxidation resistance protein 1-like isoform X2 [Coregonus clupeaformis]
MFSTKRLKKKSQSVDIATQGFSPTLVPASPINKTAAPVTMTTTLGVQQNNATNSQRICSPRCSELKRGYTIDTGQKKTQEKKDGSRRMSFQRPKGTVEYAVSKQGFRLLLLCLGVFNAFYCCCCYCCASLCVYWLLPCCCDGVL